eukprot:NODE_235_length_1770_cov_349.400583.p1 GENE.NODE_235_length_1770_cov_349.400583~~NODE_235_length_1770_cov_349.400583.p1  ORF type:complete len:533 (-),score=189.69 NODE_235_length_1770_cov_349.400583:155-1690(-)
MPIFSGAKITAKGKQVTTCGKAVGPGEWAITAKQLFHLRETHKSLFQREKGMNAREFVEGWIKKSHLDGRGVALTYNDDKPQEVAVMVSHCWDEAIDLFLLDVLTVTHNLASGGMFICFLSLYQGSSDEVNLQVTQGSTSASKGCFAEVLHTVKHNHGYMLVVSNAAVRDGAGLYSRLWCVWEVYCAVRDNVPIVVHPRTRTEKHLYGEQGENEFDPEKARCGAPGSERTADEICIRRTIGRSATCWCCFPTLGWARVKSVITNATRTVFGNKAPGTLDASKPALGDRGVELLVEAMKEDPWAYTALRLLRANISDRAAEALAEALKGNDTLEDLILTGNDGNEIGDDGAKALAEALKSNDKLLHLDLKRNDIGDDGAKALAEALKSNKTLTRLQVLHNRIGDDGAKAFAEALKANDTLKQLLFDINRIGDDGAKALAEALKTNDTLKELSLDFSLIGDDGAKALAEALKTNDTLELLRLYQSRIGDDGNKALRDVKKDKFAKGQDFRMAV